MFWQSSPQYKSMIRLSKRCIITRTSLVLHAETPQLDLDHSSLGVALQEHSFVGTQLYKNTSGQLDCG
jgi:hypothetical protein